MNAGISRRSFLGAGTATLALCALAACGTNPTTSAPVDLRSAIRGRVLFPGDNGFASSALPWNTSVTQHVRAVAEIADDADAAALVRYARDAGFTLSVQPNGHGASDDLEGVILVRPARLTELRLDSDKRKARVGAAVTWGQVLAASGPHGLIGMAGSSSAINVVGFTLGGGFSWFGRKYGWASESVTAFEIVDIDGRPRRVTAQSDPDLFWAMRGGGGDFALVTAMEFDLHPAPSVFGGQMIWPATKGAEVLSAYHEVTSTAPDELTVWFLRTQVPRGPAVVDIAAAYLGDELRGRALLSRFNAITGKMTDTCGVRPIADLGAIVNEPTTPAPSRSGGELLTGIDDATTEALLAPTPPLSLLQVRHLGGRWAGPSDSAAGTVNAAHCVIAGGIAESPEAAVELDTAIQQFRTAVRSTSAGRRPFTFLAPGDTAASAFPPDTLTRLREIKARRDPHTTIRGNFPVLT